MHIFLSRINFPDTLSNYSTHAAPYLCRIQITNFAYRLYSSGVRTCATFLYRKLGEILKMLQNLKNWSWYLRKKVTLQITNFADRLFSYSRHAPHFCTKSL